MGAYGGTPEAAMSLDAGPGNAADITADGLVDLLDIRALAEHWLTFGSPIPADVDRNTTVDFCDMAAIAGNWLWQQP